ncbi:hypothetical protein Tco_1475506 [Tanacetum coccineum]
MDKRSPIRTSSWKSIQASETRRQLATDLEMCYVHNQTDSLNLIILNKVYRSKKALYGIETSSEARCRSCRFALILAKELLENTVPSNVKRTQLQRLRASPTTKYRCIVTLSQAMQSHATRIPFGHGSFVVNVGMDLLSRPRAKMVCYKKIVQIPLSNGEILEVHEEHPEGKLK